VGPRDVLQLLTLVAACACSGGKHAAIPPDGGSSRASTGGASGAPSSGGSPGSGGLASTGGTSGSGAAVSLGTFELTYYWVTAEADFSGTANTDLFDDSCTVLATVTSAFADSLDIEGTGRLVDGRLLNVSGACPCARSPCYMEVDAQHPWGYGAVGNALVPFRSVAVDRSVVPLGTHLYVAEFDGVTMPGDPSYGQFVHDGCVSADDVGGGIVGQHLDFFAALEAHYQTLDTQLALSAVTVYEGGTRCP
jgi:3D (Asp-Asp-Asp) domain-containing protein